MTNPIAQAFIAGIWFELGLNVLSDYILDPSSKSYILSALLVTAGLFALYWYWKLLKTWRIRRPEDTP